MMARTKELASNGARQRGAVFEQLAKTWLEERGFVLLTSNYTCRGGEIDLVMKDGETVVFVEVRYRRHNRFGSAAESVDHRKQARIIGAARQYLARHSRYADFQCRFDVVALSGEQSALRINWIEGAFSA